MTDEQIEQIVQRFLSWKLPADFNPDAGISFKAEYNDSPGAMAFLGRTEPMRHEPTGTNLFNYDQAKAMVLHMLGHPND